MIPISTIPDRPFLEGAGSEGGSSSTSSDLRLASFRATSEESVTKGSIVIIGFPSDEGVRRNGGRIGAAEGPAAIREHLYKLTPDAFAYDQHVAVLERLVDLGDVQVDGDLEADQQRLGEAIARVLDCGAIAIILGGGHETAFGHYLGYASRGRSASIINIDAHADVRPLKDDKAHSGSPFRQAIEHPEHPSPRYLVAGLQPSSVSRDHLHYVDVHAGRAWLRNEVDEASLRQIFDLAEAPAMATFDLDAVDQSAAPGVSAPAVDGLDVRTWLRAARLAGETRAITSFDVSELNPRFDVDGCTARLAARTVWEITRGLAQRLG